MKYIIGCLVAGFVSAAMTDYRINSDIRANEVNGYHCTPITTHTSLDSAMEQVHKHQEKTGVLNNYNKVVGR